MRPAIRHPALVPSLCFVAVLAVPLLSQAAPERFAPQFKKPVGNPTFPKQPSIPAQPTFPQPSFPTQPTFPQPNFPFQPTFPPQDFQVQPTFPPQNFPVQPTFPMQPVPTGQYGFGVTGTFTAQGMLVKQVTAGSPAEKAGLQPNDLILKMDGVAVTNQQQFNQVLSQSGGVLQLVVQRNNQVVQVVVRLAVDGPRIQAPYMLGVRGTFGALGMTINKVYADTPAQQLGLKIGDIIANMNDVAITNNDIFFKVTHASSGQATLKIRRGGQVHTVKVRLELCRFGTLGNYTPIGIDLELIHPDTPASRAGIKVSDWIMQIDGKAATTQVAFTNAINQSGGSCVMQVKKQIGGIGNVGVLLMNNSLGCWCEPAVGGMRLLNAPQGTMAQAIGLNKGDIILFVDNQPTQNLGALQNALENARGNVVIDYRSVVTGQLLRQNVNLGNLFK